MRIAVVIATAGRPDIVSGALVHMLGQTRAPDRLLVVGSEERDFPIERPADTTVEWVVGPRGSTFQRNLGLEMVEADSDFIVFFDDDFLPQPDWLQKAEMALMAHPDVLAFTGHVIADGILGPGLSIEQAESALRSGVTVAGGRTMIDEDVPSYGCNMGFRASAIAGQRFDERLKLYAWQEDTDFSFRVARGGRRVRFHALQGVHMGVKSGRVSGRRLGYAQVANPVYLMRKGTMRSGHALPLILRNIAANVAKSLKPEPYVDRRGRLAGNMLALIDLCSGRADPERVAKI